MEMFKGKGSTIELQKEKVVVNMVLVMTNQNKTITQEDLKEKNLKKSKTQMEKKGFNNLLRLLFESFGKSTHLYHYKRYSTLPLTIQKQRGSILGLSKIFQYHRN
jgi:hypothetical protein